MPTSKFLASFASNPHSRFCARSLSWHVFRPLKMNKKLLHFTNEKLHGIGNDELPQLQLLHPQVEDFQFCNNFQNRGL